MTRPPFNEWVRDRRRAQNLTYEQCIERVNKAFGQSYGMTTWRAWEERFYEDTPRERARMIAEGLQAPLEEVFAVAGLVMDDAPEAAMPPKTARLYAALNSERRYTVDALIKILHEQQEQSR